MDNNSGSQEMGDNNTNFGAEPSGGQQTNPPVQPPATTIDPNLLNLLQLLQQGLGSGGSSIRAKASVDAATPPFRGDSSDKVDCGRWVERFEREARYYELPEADWPMAAAKRFPAESSAANWVDSMFGTGLDFAAQWGDFRRDFLSHFTPPDALAVARTNFDNLRLLPNGNVTEFNSQFSDLTTRLNCVLRDSGAGALDFSAVCLAYQTKLHGPVRIHVDQYLSQRHVFNVERQRDGRPTHEVTPRELLAAAQQFASQTDYSRYYIPQPSATQQAVATTTTPMDLDAMIKERFNALQRSGRFGGGGQGYGSTSSGGGASGSRINFPGGGGLQCWECGGKGHVRAKCPTFLARKEKDLKPSGSEGLVGISLQGGGTGFVSVVSLSVEDLPVMVKIKIFPLAITCTL